MRAMPTVAAARVEGAMPPPLSQQQVRQFMRDGWVIQRQVLSPAHLAAARDRLWEVQELPRLARTSPQSWLEPFSGDELSPADGNQRGPKSWRCRCIAAEDTILDLLPRAVFSVAASTQAPAPHEISGEETFRGVSL